MLYARCLICLKKVKPKITRSTVTLSDPSQANIYGLSNPMCRKWSMHDESSFASSAGSFIEQVADAASSSISLCTPLVLCLSYRHLPPHLKPCFLYMGVFREDSEIHVSNVIKLWVGEGFIRPNGSRELEEVAKGYIKDLIDRNLILICGRRGRNGKIRFCGIHDLLRDLCIKIGEEQEFYHVVKHNVHGTVRRLDNYNGFKDDQMDLTLARSIISYEHQSNIPRLLRVLCQEFSYLEEDFYENVNLRYLDYEHHCTSYYNELPSSISLVWNLQTLIIRIGNLNNLVVAPVEFWTMRQLRHVMCEMIYLPKPPKDEVLMLEKLQTLKATVNLILCEEVCNIIPNIKKLYLWYEDEICGYDESWIKCLCNLGLLHKLETLNLDCDYSYTTELNKVVRRFPSSLKKLFLEKCFLGEEEMVMIGSLPQLEVLYLGSSYVADTEVWSVVNGQFLRLKFLQIYDCVLVDWNGDSSSFPVLEKLLLFGLKRLREIPSDIGERPTLKLICVDKCSVSAAISAIKIKEDRLESDDSDR